MITGKTKLLGVIGDPIAHSLSPLMHNAALAAMGLDLAYLPFAIKPDDLVPAIAGLAAIGVQGFNITIPHKQAIMPLLSEVTVVAQAVGAVNTVWRTATGWSGTNTDVAGWLAPLQSLPQDWPQTNVIILGNGGAARAVVAGCAQLGCATIQVVGRDRNKLQTFQQSWETSPLSMNLQVHDWEQLSDLLPQAGLVVNTTPIGMSPHCERSPLTAADIDRLPAQVIAYDLIYTPNPTLFLQQAQAQGAVAIDGLEMLIQQGAAALQIWTQQAVPVDIMRQTLRRHLGWE
jgi:shikimate dehydrogenase